MSVFTLRVRRTAVACQTLAIAVATYERLRDGSGEGASTWPNGKVFCGNDAGLGLAGRALHVSYNGRLWDGVTGARP